MSYKRILLIDDDEDDQHLFLSALKKLDESVGCKTFFNAKDVLRQLIDGELQADLIFLDLNMPVMNGQQFLLEIKKIPALKTIPIIIFSTSSHQATRALMQTLGAAAFITKPDDFDELVKILNNVLIKKNIPI